MNEPQPLSPPSTINVAVTLVSGESGTTRVDGELRYDARDPYAVTLRVLAPSRSIDWIFARDLLADGLHGPVGTGDVQVWPCLNSEAHAVVVVELHAPGGSGLLQLPARSVRSFLGETERVVPLGRESEHLGLDRLLEQLLP